MSRPSVSVVIPTYNRATLLPRAVDSVIAQTFDDWEIVIVDDGSTDETPQVIEDYARRLGDRLIGVRQENRGSSAARNRGIDACRGEYVAFLDSDDEFLPTKLARQASLFVTRPELGFVYGDYSFVDAKGVLVESTFRTKFPLALEVPAEPIAPGLYVCTKPLFDTLIRGYFIATIVGMVRREVLGDDVRFDESQSYAEEWLFYLRVARRCMAGFVDEPVALHHWTPASLARQDRHRNAIRMCGLLDAVQTNFPDLPRRQRSAVRANLSRAARQASYDATRKGQSRVAVKYALLALRNSTSVGTAVESVNALRWGLFAAPDRPVVAESTSVGSIQAASGTVR